jgi:hypothetical protein
MCVLAQNHIISVVHSSNQLIAIILVTLLPRRSEPYSSIRFRPTHLSFEISITRRFHHHNDLLPMKQEQSLAHSHKPTSPIIHSAVEPASPLSSPPLSPFHSMSPFSLNDSPPPPTHDDHPLQLKIDYSSKGLSQVRPFPTQRRSPWVQGGNATRVLSGLARTNRRRLKRWEDEGFDSGTGPMGVSPAIEDDGESQGWRTSSGSSSSASSTVGGGRMNGGLDEDDDDEDEDEEDKVDVYYQIFVGPDHAGKCSMLW